MKTDIKQSKLRTILLFAFPFFLAACGGSEPDSPTPVPQETSAATQSVMTEGAEIIEQAEQQVEQIMAEAEDRLEDAVEQAGAMAEEVEEEVRQQAEDVEDELRSGLRSLGN